MCAETAAGDSCELADIDYVAFICNRNGILGSDEDTEMRDGMPSKASSYRDTVDSEAVAGVTF